MACAAGPDGIESGLVLALDGANYKSFKGVPATNVLNQITSNFGNQSSSLFKVTNGSETVYIPSLGYVTSKYMDFYNDYNGGSGNCCPSLFTYGTGLAVSPSTTYTYSIIYKTTTGYSHPNYMYRYEYNSGGTYLIEGGVHSEGNRTSLGDGWWFAWGQFTTQATTATLNTYLFHYEYATQNRVYVYKAALYAGTYVIPPEHMLNSGEVRGATVATGGGWADMTGRSNNGELVNGPTYNSSNGGSIVFDGVNDYVTSSFATTSGQAVTYTGWLYSTETTATYRNFVDSVTARPMIWWNTSGQIEFDAAYYTTTTVYRNQWVYVALSKPSGSSSASYYVNGVLVGSGTAYTTPAVTPTWFNRAAAQTWKGNAAQVQIYNKALTAAEIRQNFNATRGRFGI